MVPIALVVLRNPAIFTQLPPFLRKSKDNTLSPRYSAESSVPGYSLVLVDTTYLTQLTNKFNAFDDNAIVDPRTYRGFSDLKLRHTVSSIRFLLVPDIKNPIYAAAAEKRGDSPRVIWGKAEYAVEGDTLVVRVFLDIPQLNSGLIPKFALEDKYLQMASQAFLYSTGYTDQRAHAQALVDIEGMKDYLYKGVFPWPFRIEKR